MDWKVVLSTFGMIFLAEVGDKTQLATMAFAAERHRPLAVFLGAASALVFTSALAVAAGSVITRFVPARYIQWSAGALFVFVGLWMLFFSGRE